MEPQGAEGVSFRVGFEPGATCTGIDCAVADLLAEPSLVAGAALVALAVFVTFAYVSDAKRRCRTERDRTRTERRAIGRFADRVESIDSVADPTTSGGIGATQSLAGASADAGLKQVRKAYRETVMAVPHYDEEYGDSLPESIAEEFGPDVAQAVCDGAVLSPQLRDTLIARSDAARTKRRSLEEAVEAELADIDRVGARLDRIDRERRALGRHLGDSPDYGALADVWTRLGDLEDRCESALCDRQETIHDPPLRAGDRLPSFYDYLYVPLDVSHPVLAAGTELLDRIQSDRRRVLRSLTPPR
jgi:hypothetical protein